MAGTRAANGNFHDKDNYEKMQFYYHSDHLGSSSYITNLDGEVSQHIEYILFGEVFIEERNRANVSKWFLPAYGQLVKFAEALGFTLLTFTTDEPKEPYDKEGFHAGLIDKLEQIVTAANPSVTIMRDHCFLASTQMNNAGYRPMYLYFQVDGSSSTKIYTGIAGIKCTILMYYHL